MGDFLDRAVAVVFALQVFYQRFIVLYAVDVIRRVADAVKVAAEADMVVVAQKVQHIVDVAVDAVDTGLVVIFFQKLPGEGDTDQAVISIDGLYLVVVQVAGMATQGLSIGMGSNYRLGRSFDRNQR